MQTFSFKMSNEKRVNENRTTSCRCCIALEVMLLVSSFFVCHAPSLAGVRSESGGPFARVGYTLNSYCVAVYWLI